MRLLKRRILPVLFCLTATCIPCTAGILVTGKVIDRKSEPIADAEVTLTPIPDPIQQALVETHGGGKPAPMARAVTDSRGIYRLTAPDTGMWKLRVDAAARVPVETVLTPLLEETEVADAILDSDTGIQVHASDADRNPVAGVLVRIEDQQQRDYFIGKLWKKAVRTGVTDTDGNLRLPHAKDETLLLSASAEGYSFAEHKNLRGENFSLALGRGAPRSVQFLDPGGRPIAGVLLILGESGHPAGVTGEDGLLRFRTAEQPPQAYARARDGRSFHWTLQKVADAEKADLIRLPERLQLTGRVVDSETGQPVENAYVWTIEERWNSATTHRGGAYRLGLAGGNRTLKCAAAGYQEKRLFDLSLSPAGEMRLTIALDPGGVLEGTVVNAQQQPVPAVDLRVESGMRRGGAVMYWPSGSLLLRSKRDGSFRIAGLNTRMVYRIRTQSRDFAVTTKEFDFTAAMRIRKGIRIELTAGQSISGTVVDASERPVAGASVTWKRSVADEDNPYASMIPDPPVDSGATDTQGRFTAKGLSPGRVDLEVKARGFAPRRITGLEIPDRHEPIDLGKIALQNGAALFGQVLDTQKRPVEGAKVRVAPSDPFGWGMTMQFTADPGAVTGSDGWFRIDDQAAGESVDISVQREGFVDLQLPGQEVSDEPVSITLKPASTVTGKVVDPEGKGVPNATVTLLRRIPAGSGGAQRIAFANREETNSEGAFRITDVPPNMYSIAVKSAGYQDFVRDGIDVPEGKDVAGLSIALAEEALLEGSVTGPDGSPVIGATVEMLVESEVTFRPHRSRAYTDGDGAYQLHGLSPGKIAVQVMHDRYPRLARDLELRDGSNRADFQMSGGNTVSGRVVDETGAAVPGADVSLRLSSRDAGGTTDASGLFALNGIPDGDYQLRVARDGLIQVLDRIPVQVAGAPVDNILVAMRAGITLTGNILGLEGDEAAQVSIEAFHDQSSDFRLTRADYQGTYRLQGLRPGKWSVSAVLPGDGKHANAEITIEEGTRESRLDLQFGKGLKLAGRVVQDDRPLPGVDVSASGKEMESYASASTGPDGHFEMEGLEKGRHEIHVSDWNNVNYRKEIDLQQDQEILLTIPQTKVRGRTVDAFDGSPVSGVFLSLSSAETIKSNVLNSGSSGSDGTFEIRNVGAGDWILTANKDGYAAATRTIHAPEGQDVEAGEIPMQPTEGITLQVRLPGGAAADRVSFAVMDPGGRNFLSGSPATREGGTLRISTIPAGTWEILLAASGSAITSMTATVPATSPLIVNLQPAASLRIRVPALSTTKWIAKATVTGENGKPFRILSYWSGVSAELDVASGELLIDRMPAGNWSVTVTAPDGSGWTGTATTNAGTTTDLTLE